MKTHFCKTLTFVLLFLLAGSTIFALNTDRLFIKVEKKDLKQYVIIRKSLLDNNPGQIDTISSFPHNQQRETSCAFFEIWMVHPDIVQDIMQAFSGIANVIPEHQSPGTLKEEEYSDYSPYDCDNLWYLEAINYGDCFQNLDTATIAIIDDGIDINHVALRNNIWVNQGEIPENWQWLDTNHNGIIESGEIYNEFQDFHAALTTLSDTEDNDGNGYVDDIFGWNFVGNNNNVFPELEASHGTHMAGINHSIAENALLMPLKCFYSDRAFLGNIIASIVYAQSKNTQVGNCSFGYFNSDDIPEINDLTQILYETMQCADKVLFACSAGNDIPNNNNDVNFHYPSNFSSNMPHLGVGLNNVISVGGINEEYQSVYNFGIYTVDLMAPATYICSTIPNNGYAMREGTSCSAAMGSAAAALWYSDNPSLSPAEIKQKIRNTATNYGLPCSTGGILTLCSSKGYYNNKTQQSTGVEQVGGNLSIYPNPVSNLLTVSGIKEPTVVTVCSISGSIMQITELNSGSTEINVNNLANGVYILKLQTATNVVVKRFIKQ